MKAKIILAGLSLFGTTFAADASKILLIGRAVAADDSRVSGAARALVGDMSVSAETITFDRRTNVLKCEGPVSIKMGGSVVTAKDCVIELSSGEKAVFFLNPDGIAIQPNKAPEPTPMSVTPPATQESRRP